MKKRNINDILGSSDDKNIKRIADSYDIISEKKSEELYSRIAKRTGLSSDSDYADKVSGVEVRRNSSILRFIGSAAACVAVIGGLSAGAIAMKGMKKVPSSEFTETTETTETVTEKVTERISGAAAYLDDLPEAFNDEEKLHIFDLIINSTDNFRKVSGKYIKNNTNTNIMCDIIDYQIDQDIMEAYESVSRENLLSPVENVVNDEPFDSIIDEYMGVLNIYCTDTAQYALDNDNKTYTISAQSADTPKTVTKLDARTIAGIMYKKEIDNDFEFDYDDGTVFRNYSLIYNTAYSSVYPIDFAYGQLYDFTAWEITGEVSYAGRECYGIEGHIPYYPYEPTDNGTADFKALIDKKTGCLLKYILYDPNGGYLDWLITKSIKFDEEADPVTIDFSAYSKYDYPDVSNEIGCNSKGETYGSNIISANAYNYSELPDLIAYKGVFNSTEIKGYMRKTELFEVFPISPAEQSKRCASTIKGEGTPEGTDINVYDSEGENVLFVVTYYNMPDKGSPWLGHTDSGKTFGPMTDDSYDALPDLICYAVPDDPDNTVCYIRKTDLQDILSELPRELHMSYSFRWKTDSDTDKKEITCYDLNNNTVGTLVYDPQN